MTEHEMHTVVPRVRRPTSRPARGQDDRTKPENVAASVEYLVDGTVRVTHPEGSTAENHRLTVARLRARGHKIAPPATNPD